MRITLSTEMTARIGLPNLTAPGSHAPDQERKLSDLIEAIVIEEIEAGIVDAIGIVGLGRAVIIGVGPLGQEIASVMTAVSVGMAIDTGIVATAGQRGTTLARENIGKIRSKTRRAHLRLMNRDSEDRPLRRGEL